MGCLERKVGSVKWAEDSLLKEVCESKKAVATTKEVTRSGGHGADCWVQSERLHHRQEDFHLHSASTLLGASNKQSCVI